MSLARPGRRATLLGAAASAAAGAGALPRTPARATEAQGSAGGPDAAAAATPPEPEGYRMDPYRAPVPLTLRGAIALDTPMAERVFRTRTDVTWVNVLPVARRPANLPADALWRPRPQTGVPGSVWLPEVGRGELSPALADWFREEMYFSTSGDRNTPVVFYCLSDCWMGWNAGKRALSLGYTAVLWYRDGLDGWEAAGLPVAELRIAPNAPI